MILPGAAAAARCRASIGSGALPMQIAHSREQARRDCDGEAHDERQLRQAETGIHTDESVTATLYMYRQRRALLDVIRGEFRATRAAGGADLDHTQTAPLRHKQSLATAGTRGCVGLEPDLQSRARFSSLDRECPCIQFPVAPAVGRARCSFFHGRRARARRVQDATSRRRRPSRRVAGLRRSEDRRGPDHRATTCVHRLRRFPATNSKAARPRRRATRRRANTSSSSCRRSASSRADADGSWQQTFDVVGITADMPKQWTFSKGGKKRRVQVVGSVHRRQRRADREGLDQERRSRVRRLRHPGARVRLGRLQGPGPEGQSAADAEQRSGLGSDSCSPATRGCTTAAGSTSTRAPRARAPRARSSFTPRRRPAIRSRSCRLRGAASRSSCRRRASRASR